MTFSAEPALNSAFGTYIYHRFVINHGYTEDDRRPAARLVAKGLRHS